MTRTYKKFHFAKRYMALIAEDVAELLVYVDQAQQDGWECQGGFGISWLGKKDMAYTQAMVLPRRGDIAIAGKPPEIQVKSPPESVREPTFYEVESAMDAPNKCLHCVAEYLQQRYKLRNDRAWQWIRYVEGVKKNDP